MKIKPVKNWGQVFLKNENIKKKIAEVVNNSEAENLLEIGPGLGAITRHIDIKNKKYWAVEIDRKLAHLLTVEFENINVLNIDFLKIDLTMTELSKQKVLVFGNIPYYITTPIFVKFLKTQEFYKSYFMVQKEYFEMISANYKTKQYSSFSALIQTFCKVEKMFSIDKINFFPKPKIDSVFISLEKLDKEIFNFAEEYFQFLRICFHMPRKTLFNNLRKKIEKEKVEIIFNENEIPLNIRPDEISPNKFELIFLSRSCKDLFKNFF